MKVLKFGGSSIGSVERIKDVVEIIKQSKQKNSNIAVVASAMQGVTNKLVDAGNQAFLGNQDYIAVLQELETLHLTVANELL